MRSHFRRHAARGFTLAEVMTVVAIVAILAAMAWPSFADAIHRSHRTDGVTALEQLQLAQERWRTDHATYAAELQALAMRGSTPGGYYTIAIVDADDEGYVATATATSTQASDERCRTLRLALRAGSLSHASINGAGVVDTTSPNPCWHS